MSSSFLLRQVSRLFALLFLATAAVAQVPAPLTKPRVELRLTGEVSSIARQPNGGLVLVGTFTSIDGVPRDGLARLRPDGSLDPQWYPRVQWSDSAPTYARRRVYALSDGSVLVRGDVDRINGQMLFGCGVRLSADPSPAVDTTWNRSASCVHTHAFDDDGHYYFFNAYWPYAIRRGNALTGELDENWIAYTDSMSSDQLVYDGNGGIIVQEGNRLVRRFSADGTIDAQWSGPASPFDTVAEFAVDRARGVLYVAYVYLGLSKHVLATGQPASGWNDGGFLNMTRGIVVDSAGDVYAGGRYKLVKLSGGSGALLQSWNAEGVNQYVHDLVELPDGRVVAAGSFARLGQTRAFGLAGLSSGGAQPVAMAAAMQNGGATAMALQPDGGIVVAGVFDSVDGLERRRLFRLRPDGELDPTWAPFADDLVSSLVADSHGDIYALGSFRYIDGIWLDSHIAKISGATGAVVASWIPEIGGSWATGVALDDADRVYVSASSSNTQLAFRLSPADGRSDPSWRPAGSFRDSFGLVRLGGDIYVSVLDEQSRTILRRAGIGDAVVDAGWSLDLGGMRGVPLLARASDGDLMLGGNFSSISGYSLSGLARVSATAPAQLRAWYPALNGSVGGLAASPDGRLFVSGWFTRIDGKPRNSVAELSPDSGAVLDSWVAPAGGFSLLLAPDRIYLAPNRYGVIAYPLNIGDTIFATRFD